MWRKTKINVRWVQEGKGEEHFQKEGIGIWALDLHFFPMSVSRIHSHLLLAQCSWIHEALLAGRLHKRSCHGAEIQWEFNRRRKTRSINCALLWLVSAESAIFSSQTPPVWFNISISLLKYNPSVQLPYTLFLALSLSPPDMISVYCLLPTIMKVMTVHLLCLPLFHLSQNNQLFWCV